MVSGSCALGDDRPDVCKRFPQRQSDIDNCGRNLGEASTCVAEIGGSGCDHCGQCCRDKPWPERGYIDGDRIIKVDENGTCEYYIGEP